MTRSLLLPALLTFVAACQGGSAGTSAEGIYEITTWTENTDSCAAEGPSITGPNSDPLLYVANSSFFGQSFISVVTCPDLATCRTESGENSINLSGFAFEKGSDGKGWTGSGYFIGGSETCSGEVFEDRLEVGEDTVTIERRSKEVENIPLDSEGFCDGDAAETLAETLPCTRLETIKAGLEEAL